MEIKKGPETRVRDRKLAVIRARRRGASSGN